MKKTTILCYHQSIKLKITINKFFFFLIAIMFATGNLMSQGGKTHINREWYDYTGNPVFNPLLNPFGLEWTKSIPSASAGLIVVGHTQVSGQGENILITKYDDGGSIIWQSNYNTGGTRNDYGIDLIEDINNGDVYIVGTTDNGGTTNYDVVVLVYNSSGVLQNSTSYDANGLNDIGTAINFDSYGYPIVCASSESSSTMSDFLLLCYDPTLSLQWTPTTYDYASLIDVPVGIESIGGKIRIAGASASSLTDWDYVVAEFDESNGSYLGDTRDNITGVGYDQPLAFVKDASNNTYVTGRASSDGINYDIRTMKINANNTIAWTQTIDANGLEDCGNTIVVDGSGNIIIGGFVTRPNNSKEIYCAKYNASGTLLWEHSQPSKDMTADAYIKKIVLNTNNDIYFIAGEKGYTGNKEVIIGKIKANGKKSWERNINGNYDYLPSDIQFGGGGAPGPFTIAIKDSTVNVYEIAYYSEHERDTARVFKGNGKPWYKKNELLVRFQSSAMDTAAINNHIGTKKMEFGDLSSFLTAPAYTTVINALARYCDDICYFKAIRIFDDPTTFTITQSRLGENVPVPDFWTSLLMELPSNISVPQAITAFTTIPQTVVYAHPNYFIYPDTPLPNDTAYKNQHSINTSTVYPNAGINVKEAWDVDSLAGKAFVKVGVFDTGINWQHPDFDYDGGSPYSSKIRGWDLVAEQPVLNNPIGDGNGHGTMCAGIIGATRNNTLGMAGIAGGNKLAFPNNNVGVQLYSFNIMDSIGSDIVEAGKAIINAAKKGNPNPNYQYGLNIMSNSWGIDSLYGDTTIAFLNHAVHFANRQKVTFVASRGNNGENSAHYPATTDDDWVLCVGATASDGNYKDFNIDDANYAGDYGRGVDIAAPGSIPTGAPLVWTTNIYNTYNPMSGTSASVPHVVGVSGLLMSYMNAVNDDPKNLAPEDVEFIIQKSASPMPNGISLPNDSVGYGRLNAGKAMRMVEKPFRTLYHFATNTLTPYTISKSVYSNVDTITLTENYQNKATPQVWFQAGSYIVKTFLITANLNHVLQFPTTDSAMYCWPRHSSSEVFALFNANKKLVPRERVQINSYSSGSAYMQGYVYEVKDMAGNNVGWWPCDTSFSSAAIKTLFSYSILTKNTAVGIKENNKDDLLVSIFPNPTTNNQTITINSEKESDLTIQLYDLMGRHLKTIYTGRSKIGQNSIISDVGNLPNSVYIYLIKLGDNQISKRFIKQ